MNEYAVTVSDRNCNLHVTAKSVTPFIISLHWVSHQLPHHCKIYDKMKVLYNKSCQHYIAAMLCRLCVMELEAALIKVEQNPLISSQALIIIH